MKSLFKMLFIFLVMTIALLSNPSALQTQSIDLVGSIQNTPKETVILVSNNMLSGSIISNSKEENNSISGTTPLIISYLTQDNIYNENKSFNKGYSIHKISTNNQKIQQIRAP